MHHLILGKPPDRKTVVDHINQDKVDNSRENLRFASLKLNAHNRVLEKTDSSTSKYVGVRYKKNRGTKHIGAFTTEIEAARAYDAYVYQIHREDAVMNLIYTDKERQEMLQLNLGKTPRDLPIGVSWDKQKNKYCANLNLKFLGYFESIQEAADIYISAKEKFLQQKAAERNALPILRNSDEKQKEF